MAALPDGQTAVAIWLALLFLSSMGEAYFPDLMKINKLQANTNWLFVADALGNMAGALAPTAESWRDVPASKAVIPALCDAVSKMFILGGIALSSAQLKSILYNSCIVFSALLSRLVLGRILSVGQWSGVAVLILGLAVKLDLGESLAGDSDAVLLPIGMFFILIGCALHSLTNVVNEYYIRCYSFPPAKLCCLVGLSNFTMWLLLVMSGFIIPEKQGDNPFGHYTRDYISLSSLQANMGAWLGFVISSAVHALAYYNLLGSIGVVSCGVMKGLTTVGYVTLSAVVLCERAQVIDPKDATKLISNPSEKYCLTTKTFVSSLFCFAGVVIYSVFSSKAKQQEQPRHRASSDAVAENRAHNAEPEPDAIEMGTPLAVS